MMKETDKRCGTCKWWNEDRPCERPLPWWVPEAVFIDCSIMDATEGADCDCWEAKDED